MKLFLRSSLFALVAFVIATGRRVMSDAAYRALMVVCGLALVALGIYFIFSAVRLWLG